MHEAEVKIQNGYSELYAERAKLEARVREINAILSWLNDKLSGTMEGAKPVAEVPADPKPPPVKTEKAKSKKGKRELGLVAEHILKVLTQRPTSVTWIANEIFETFNHSFTHYMVKTNCCNLAARGIIERVETGIYRNPNAPASPDPADNVKL